MDGADQAVSAPGLNFFGYAGFVIVHSHRPIVSEMGTPLWAKGKAQIQEPYH
jgi:hypothetical protein